MGRASERGFHTFCSISPSLLLLRFYKDDVLSFELKITSWCLHAVVNLSRDSLVSAASWRLHYCCRSWNMLTLIKLIKTSWICRGTRKVCLWLNWRQSLQWTLISNTGFHNMLDTLDLLIQQGCISRWWSPRISLKSPRIIKSNQRLRCSLSWLKFWRILIHLNNVSCVYLAGSFMRLNIQGTWSLCWDAIQNWIVRFSWIPCLNDGLLLLLRMFQPWQALPTDHTHLLSHRLIHVFEFSAFKMWQ